MTTKLRNEEHPTDAPTEIERLHVELIRKAPVVKRIRLLRSLSRTALYLSRRAVREARPHLTQLQLSSAIIALQYDLPAIDLSVVKIEALVKGEMDKPDILTALIPVVETLKKIGIAYYIGGSVASSAYGLPRSTVDVDLIADMKKEHIKPFAQSLQGAYYVDENRVRDAVERRASFNLIHFDTLLKVDIFISKMRPYDREVFQRVLQQKLDEAEDSPLFYLETPEDVVLAKLEWYRAGAETSQRQWSDIIGILKVQATKIDLDYLRKWASTLGLSDLLEQAIAES